MQGSKVLLNQGYCLSETIQHREFNAFILNHKWKYSILHLIYLSFASFSFVLTVYLILYHSHFIQSGLILAGFGLLLSFLLIPIHESIHYLMFKFFGADKVIIKPYFRKFYFLTLSHHFPIGKKEIKWIALMPFIIITVLGFVLFSLSNYHWQIIISSAVLFHTSTCSTDFRIVNLFLAPEKEYKMYTDIDEDITYLFSRKY